MTPPRIGRPPVAEPLRKVRRWRFTDAADALLVEAAGGEEHVTEWGRAVIMAAARRDAAKRRRAAG